jgi:hypothetical protein
MVTNHVLVFSTGKYMDSSTGTGNVRDHTRISAHASIHLGISVTFIQVRPLGNVGPEEAN